MPRDMTATGRYPPQPKHKPIAFYSAVRLGDPDFLAEVMATDPYYITQDNGAGAPIHFATTYRQLDMIHHLLNNGAEINQRDDKGFTPLHRAAYLAHYDGYLEIFEYLLSRGADPSILTEDYDPYLDPGRKLAVDVAVDDEMREELLALIDKYAEVAKVREPHEDIGCWWTLYDYGLEAVKRWPKDHKKVYPEDAWRAKEQAERRRLKEERRRRTAAAAATSHAPAPTPQPALLPAPAPQPATPAAAVSGPAPQPAAPAQPPARDAPIAFLFTGQGAQAVGMLKDSKDIPAVRDMLATAQNVLGYDLLQICLEGPRERLDATEVAQPALFVAGLAAVEKLRRDEPKHVAACGAAAGLSLGEYCALVFAGALSFEDGLKVVKARAEGMAAAAAAGRPHGMLSVLGLEDGPLDALCAAARQKIAHADTVCQVANYLFPTGRVVAGHRDALDEVQRAAPAAGALRVVPLAVSGAFHTSLMQPAQDALVAALAVADVRAPCIPVYSNVTGAPYGSADDIRSLLVQQLVAPVRWEGILKALVRDGAAPQLFELGPGAQIKAMVKRVDTTAFRSLVTVVP